MQLVGHISINIQQRRKGHQPHLSNKSSSPQHLLPSQADMQQQQLATLALAAATTTTSS